jgi:hypothetical protein
MGMTDSEVGQLDVEATKEAYLLLRWRTRIDEYQRMSPGTALSGETDVNGRIEYQLKTGKYAVLVLGRAGQTVTVLACNKAVSARWLQENQHRQLKSACAALVTSLTLTSGFATVRPRIARST